MKVNGIPLTKKILLLLIALAATTLLQAQQNDKDYTSLYNKVYKAYVKAPNDVVNLLEMANFYSDTLNPMLDYPTAMRYITEAENNYIEILEDRDRYKEAKRLVKKKISVADVRRARINMAISARQWLDRQEDVSDATLDSYTATFKNDPRTQRVIERKRMDLRYKHALQKNTLAAYKTFIDSYGSTEEGEEAGRQMARLASSLIDNADSEDEVDSILTGYLDIEAVKNVANRKKSSIAYTALVANPSRQAYKTFMAKYPGSDEYSLILERMDEILREDFETLTDPRQYADFALNNPDNPIAENALNELKRLIREERNMEALDIYMNEFQLDVDYNEIFLDYFKWHTEEGNLSPVSIFAVKYPDFPYKMAVQDALVSATKIDSININIPFAEKEFRDWASKIYHLTGKKESFVALQRTLQQYIAAKQWNKASERINYFSLSFEDNCVDEVSELRSVINRQPNPKLSTAIDVHPAYNLMHPVIHPDGTTLFYNRDVEGHECIQSAQKSAGKKGSVWRGTGNITFSNVENKDLKIFNFFDNGNKMLLGKNGDILVAERGENGWVVTETLPEPVNSSFNDFDAFMLPDSSGILIASDRPGGHNLQPSRSYFHGDTALASDIYYIPLTKKGWGKPINLGINVNSPYMECSPAISSDLKTLYFITDGRGGLGYGDIYYTTRDNTDDWCHWATPTNYGKEINTGFNENSITFSNDGKHLTFGSNYEGHYGCYHTAAFHTINENFKSISINTEEVGLSVEIIDLSSFKSIVKELSIERQSTWLSSFYSDRDYMLYARCNGLFIPAVPFSPSNNTAVTPVAYDETNLLALSGQDKPLVLHGIIFENNKEHLVSCSKMELDQLADFLRRHPKLVVELSIHVGGIDDTFCYNLSQSRGTEVKRHLVIRGVDSDRIVVSPYGNSMTKKGQAQTSISAKFTRQD